MAMAMAATSTFPNYRAWRFTFPEADAPAGAGLEGERVAAGVTLVDGRVSMAEESTAVRQAILLLLATSIGERVMRPDYGCDLNKLIFSPNDDTTAGLAIHYVRQALRLWEPRIDVLRLDAGRSVIDLQAGSAAPGGDGGDDDGGDRLYIALEYRLRATRVSEHLVFSISLGGDT